eukprot:scaffold130582_cov30-Tisochrysis_lutea.AAC.5
MRRRAAARRESALPPFDKSSPPPTRGRPGKEGCFADAAPSVREALERKACIRSILSRSPSSQ